MITTAQQTAENYLFGPMDLAFLQPVRLTDFVYYGYGGCTSKIVMSPAPRCEPIYSHAVTTAAEIPPWYPPVDPDGSVPVAGTLLLFGLGLILMRLVRK